MRLLPTISFYSALILGSAPLYGQGPKAEPNIEAVNVTLKSKKSNITCADYSKLKESIAKDLAAYRTDRSFFEPTQNDKKSPSFITFDKKTYILSVCDKGKITHVEFDGRRIEDSQINIEQAYLVDMNNDGKKEFLVGDLQCVEGPCLGSYYLYQVDGNKIKKTNIIHTTLHELKDVGKEKVLQLKKLCFTHDFGIAFEWFALGTFANKKKLTELPLEKIRQDYPSVLKDFEAEIKGQIERSKEFPSDKENDAYVKISNLLLRAYKGEPAKKLIAEYDSIAKPFVNTGGLPIYCEPKDLINAITK